MPALSARCPRYRTQWSVSFREAKKNLAYSNKATKTKMRGARPFDIDELPDAVLVSVAKFLLEDGLRGAHGVVPRVYAHVRSLRQASKKIHGAITVDSLRPEVARVLRIALPHQVSTKMLVQFMRNDAELAPRLLLESGASKEASVALLSRLVNLSREAQADRAAGKDVGIITDLIRSARPALANSLRAATVGDPAVAMYPNPEKAASDVVERMQNGPYEAADPFLSESIGEFMDPQKRRGLIERFGPLCLWDVSNCFLSDACKEPQNFNSDLFWDTQNAENMESMFHGNAAFKGYIGTWDVSKVQNMRNMFCNSGIEDSGIANWNTASLKDAYSMFNGAVHLSASLDLSKWQFQPEAKLSCMFEGSSIVDGGISEWDVSSANTRDMLYDARKFSAYKRLLAKWDEIRLRDASVPQERHNLHPVSFGTQRARSRLTDADIARYMVQVTRSHHKRSRRAESQKCSIL